MLVPRMQRVELVVVAPVGEEENVLVRVRADERGDVPRRVAVRVEEDEGTVPKEVVRVWEGGEGWGGGGPGEGGDAGGEEGGEGGDLGGFARAQDEVGVGEGGGGAGVVKVLVWILTRG